MKKIIARCTAISLLSLLFAVQVFAAESSPGVVIDIKTKTVITEKFSHEVVFKFENNRLYLDGKKDYATILSTGYGFSNGLINPSTMEFVKDNKVTVQYGSDKPVVLVNDEAITVQDEVLSQLQQGWIPLRYVYELAGYDVSYDKNTYTVTIK